MGETLNYRFRTTGPGEDLFGDNFRQTLVDPQRLDAILEQLREHRHDGSEYTADDIDVELDLEVYDNGGALDPATDYYYRFTLINPSGLASPPSEEVMARTPDPILEPDAPSLTHNSTGGNMLSGTYLYAVSAYAGDTNNETRLGPAVQIRIPVGTTTNSVSMEMPDLPEGALGFNVYRQSPGSTTFYWVGTSTPLGFSDTSATVSTDRQAPLSNVTGNDSAIRVSLPDDFTLQPGYTWKIYRTSRVGLWQNTFVHHVVEETSEGSGVITDTFLDTSPFTQTGSPFDETAVSMTNPGPIDLETETTGILSRDRIEDGTAGAVYFDATGSGTADLQDIGLGEDHSSLVMDVSASGDLELLLPEPDEIPFVTICVKSSGDLADLDINGPDVVVFGTIEGDEAHGFLVPTVTDGATPVHSWELWWMNAVTESGGGGGGSGFPGFGGEYDATEGGTLDLSEEPTNSVYVVISDEPVTIVLPDESEREAFNITFSLGTLDGSISFNDTSVTYDTGYTNDPFRVWDNNTGATVFAADVRFVPSSGGWRGVTLPSSQNALRFSPQIATAGSGVFGGSDAGLLAQVALGQMVIAGFALSGGSITVTAEDLSTFDPDVTTQHVTFNATLAKVIYPFPQRRIGRIMTDAGAVVDVLVHIEDGKMWFLDPTSALTDDIDLSTLSVAFPVDT